MTTASDCYKATTREIARTVCEATGIEHYFLNGAAVLRCMPMVLLNVTEYGFQITKVVGYGYGDLTNDVTANPYINAAFSSLKRIQQNEPRASPNDYYTITFPLADPASIPNCIDVLLKIIKAEDWNAGRDYDIDLC